METKENAATGGASGDAGKEGIAKGEPEPSGTRGERQGSTVTPATLAILTCDPAQRATKRWHSGLDGKPVCEEFDAGKWFTHTAHTCRNIIELHKLLDELEVDPQAFVIRGMLAPGVDPARVRRKKKPVASEDGKVYFADPPGGLPWVMLDFDKVSVPGADLIGDPAAAVAALVARLPDEFHDVTYHWQLSSSAGMTDNRIVRAHIWFWLDRPVTNEELVLWAEGIDADIDATLFRTVQPHYTAAPIFDGVVDPLTRRSGLAEGTCTHVTMPPAPMPAANGSDGPRVGLAALPGYEAKLSVLGDGPGLKGFNGPLVSAIAAYVYRAGAAGTDRQALKKDLRRAIDAAPKSATRGADIARYKSDDYLDEAIDSAIEQWGDVAETKRADDDRKAMRPAVITMGDLHTMEIEEREYIIEPFFRASSLSLLYAKRGAGKTWVAMQLAFSVAGGEEFFGYKVPRPRRVLFVDGEMPLADLQERSLALSGGKAMDNLDWLPSELLWATSQPLRINTKEDQGRIADMLDTLTEEGRRPDVLIFDNLSSLTGGMDENSNSELDDMLQWMIGLRHQGYAVLLVHHAGKGGDQRGASRREDLLDTTIKLEEPTRDPSLPPLQGAAFTLSFTKVRGARPQPDTLNIELRTDADGRLEWMMDSVQRVPRWMELLRAMYNGPPTGFKTQKEVAEVMGVSAARVSELLKVARAKGLADARGLTLTVDGKCRVELQWPGDRASDESEDEIPF